MKDLLTNLKERLSKADFNVAMEILFMPIDVIAVDFYQEDITKREQEIRFFRAVLRNGKKNKAIKNKALEIIKELTDSQEGAICKRNFYLSIGKKREKLLRKQEKEERRSFRQV
jgi:hypothetical protein